ncbi:hypothetical protein D9M73_126480 [compost metagenome]
MLNHSEAALVLRSSQLACLVLSLRFSKVAVSAGVSTRATSTDNPIADTIVIENCR